MLVELSALAVANLGEYEEIADRLRSAGAEDDLYAACHRGDLDTISRMLIESPNLAHRPARNVEPHPRMGYLPIHYAVAGKQLDATRLLIANGASIGDQLGLLVDWADGNRSLIRYLRQRSKEERRDSGHATTKPGENASPVHRGIPSVDHPDWLGFPQLVDACRGNHNATDDPERVERLLKRGANIDIRDHKGKTPLHRACQAGFLKITTLLLDNGAQLEISDHLEATPIFDAASYGRTGALALMLEREPNLSHQDKRGETPLFAAARGGSLEAFELLLTAGSDLQHENRRGQKVWEMLNKTRSKSPGRRQILRILHGKMP